MVKLSLPLSLAFTALLTTISATPAPAPLDWTMIPRPADWPTREQMVAMTTLNDDDDDGNNAIDDAKPPHHKKKQVGTCLKFNRCLTSSAEACTAALEAAKPKQMCTVGPDEMLGVVTVGGARIFLTLYEKGNASLPCVQLGHLARGIIAKCTMGGRVSAQRSIPTSDYEAHGFKKTPESLFVMVQHT